MKESSQVQEGVSVSGSSSTVSAPPTTTSSLNTVSASVVMSSNQLPAQAGHSLHDAADALVTLSESMSSSFQHSARVITNSTNNVVLTTANNNLITQSKPPVGYNSMSSDSHVSLLTSSRDPATSFVSTSLPILPAIGSGIVQPSATVLPVATVVPMYGNQLPPISRFTGEEDCSESGMIGWSSSHPSRLE